MNFFKLYYAIMETEPGEREDFKDQITIGEFGSISVPKAYAFAKSRPAYLKTLSTKTLEPELDWWDKNYQHMKTVDTSYPLLVFQMEGGHLTVADGLNRLKKTIAIEGKKEVKAYVVPFNDLPDSVYVTKTDNH